MPISDRLYSDRQGYLGSINGIFIEFYNDNIVRASIRQGDKRDVVLIPQAHAFKRARLDIGDTFECQLYGHNNKVYGCVVRPTEPREDEMPGKIPNGMEHLLSRLEEKDTLLQSRR